ncbi:PucR family transcriptional regulator ligand-binding domain-containing protein [Virgibacillus halophilus]|uniref:PucR family transcriptional regulator ligand-binding domain-containing protein n=1 Tax=Tigheibacillus halophilus TaxID=361280 RepID=A0ABU5C8C6_9BACI|nr:PucR family transcriptional regulator ligand-binding domain-containing protein [Virgibacillus halophilus]
MLTTGFSLQREPDRFRQLIIELNAANCSGLAIKVERFMQEIPEDALEVANILDFPVISLPVEDRLTDISHVLLRYLWGNKMDDMFEAFKVQKKFAAMMVKGASTKRLVEQLGYLLETAVFLYNPFGYLVASIDHVCLEMPGLQKKLQSHFRHHIPFYNDDSHPIFKELEFQGKSIPLLIFPVGTSHAYPHILVIAGMDVKAVSVPVVEQAASVISSTLLKFEAIKENERVAKNNFFHAFTDGNILSEEEAIHRGAHFGLQKGYKYLCAVCCLDEEEQMTTFDQERKTNSLSQFIFELLPDLLKERFMEPVTFMKNRYFGVVYQFPQKYDKHLKHAVYEALRLFQLRMETDYQLSISIGISNFTNDFMAIPHVYMEAIDALQTAVTAGESRVIRFYKTKDVRSLLRMIPEDNVRDFYEETMRSLAYAATKEEKDLIATLAAFFG